MATRRKAKRATKRTQHPPLSRQVEDAFLAGLARMGITKQHLAKEHRALKRTLEKVDAAAGHAVKSIGEEVGQLSGALRKTAARAKKRVVGGRTAKKKTAKRKPAKKRSAKKKATRSGG